MLAAGLHNTGLAVGVVGVLMAIYAILADRLDLRDRCMFVAAGLIILATVLLLA